MKFTCDKTLLFDAINTASKAVSSKSSLPILEGLLIETMNDSIKITGYDLELAINSISTAKILKAGKTVLNARMLSDIVRSLPDGEVLIENNEETNTSFIKCGMSSFKIPSLSADEFPGISLSDNESSFTINQNKLKSMIRQTIFSASTDPNKPMLCGSLFELDGGILTLVSLENARIAVRKEVIENSKDLKLKFIIPAKALHEMIKIFDDSEKDIIIDICSKHVTFTIENVTVTSRLLEGNFFNYKSAIPQSSAINAIVSTKEFIDAITRASLLISEKIRSHIITEYVCNDINISCTSGAGNFNDKIDCIKNGDDIKIAFYHKYMLDALKAADCDKILIGLNSPTSAIVITPTEREKIGNIEFDRFLFLVLPVNIK